MPLSRVLRRLCSHHRQIPQSADCAAFVWLKNTLLHLIHLVKDELKNGKCNCIKTILNAKEHQNSSVSTKCRRRPWWDRVRPKWIFALKKVHFPNQKSWDLLRFSVIACGPSKRSTPPPAAPPESGSNKKLSNPLKPVLGAAWQWKSSSPPPKSVL